LEWSDVAIGILLGNLYSYSTTFLDEQMPNAAATGTGEQPQLTVAYPPLHEFNH
jgi:hypothetical protein